MQPSPLATGSPLSYKLLGDAGKKGRGENGLKISQSSSYFGILIYKKRKKNRNESQDPTAGAGADEIPVSGCRTAALPPFLCSHASKLKLCGLCYLHHIFLSPGRRDGSSGRQNRTVWDCRRERGPISYSATPGEQWESPFLPRRHL